VVLSLVVLAGLLPSASAPVSAADAPTVSLRTGDQGTFLVGPNGMTLYIFKKDQPSRSNCAEKCVDNWPLLTVAEGATPTAGEGVPGKLEVINCADGKTQVAYNGQPLYYWVKDTAAGQTTGEGVGNVWYLARPDTLTVSRDEKLGSYLVAGNGMTVYLYTKDTVGESACYDKCAQNWPPMLAKTEKDLPATIWGVPGKVGLTKRTDGTLQVTYNDVPLYYWVKDVKPGDTTGQDVGQVWYVIRPETVVVGKNDALGEFLIGANGMTLYLYTKDKPGESVCYDKCAVNWPPLLVAEGEPLVAGAGVTGKLGTTKRTDGTFQVTYSDVPLYYWIKDVVPGDTTGQDVGQVWYVLKP
jgi:predicted lipoprotein with Yx(FWY)xxD motif